MNKEQCEVKDEMEVASIASSGLDAKRKVERVSDAFSVETLASDVISIVRSFIGALRLEFQQQIQTQTQLARVSLYEKIKDRGLVEKVRLIQRREHTDLPPQRLKVDCSKLSSGNKEKKEMIEKNKNGSFELQRQKIMQEVALPLAELLARCYDVLDNLPSEVPNPDSAKINPTNNRKSVRRKNRPKPPRGMLSIQDYTDVACLLEFLVCTGILPFTAHYRYAASDASNSRKVPTSSSVVEERIRSKLPKSLSGRIPKNALRWGTSSLQSSSLQKSFLLGRIEESAPLLTCTTEAVAKLVLLDRFRPMLLPRHAVDLYEAIFSVEFYMMKMSTQRDRYVTISNEQDSETKEAYSKNVRLVDAEFYQALGLSLPPLSRFLPHTDCSEKQRVAGVDPTVRAMAYQTLLSCSSSLSQSENHQEEVVWLRNRVSKLLTELATQDVRGLAAIVTVFVPIASSSNDQTSLMSGAAQRLGRTLVAMTTIPASSHRQTTEGMILQGRLCDKLLDLLVIAFPVIVEATGATTTSKISIPPRSMAVIQTAWAVFENMSNQTIDRHILEVWEQRLYGGRDKKILTARNIGGSIHETIRQIGALCAFVPPHSSRAIEILKRTLMKATVTDNKSGNDDIRCDKCNNILGQILRVAMHDNQTPKNLCASTSRDAEWTLLWLTQAIFAHDSVVASLADQEKARDEIVAAFVLALGPTSWDLEGHRFVCSTPAVEKGDDSRVKLLEIKQYHRLEHRTAIEEFTESVQFTTKSAEFFVDNILLALAPNAPNASNHDGMKETIDSRLLILGLPSRIFRFLLRHYISKDEKNDNASLRIVATILLPILCERCSQEQLLFGENKENTTGLLTLIREVLSATAEEELNRYDRAEKSAGDFEGDDVQRYEFLKSIASILLSMLIAVMELGSKFRSTEEEEIIQSFLPVLKRLSIPVANRNLNTKDDMRECAAMADMAAYAMALVASRVSIDAKLSEADNTKTKVAALPLSSENGLQRILKDAETDLRSTQPPLRARGMVSLGKLARGFAGSLSSGQNTPSLILKLNEGGEVVGGIENDAPWISEVLRLSMVALEDTESYVYLAAVQTIVAVGDLHPRHVLPLISSAIVRGELDSFSTVTMNKNSTPISLSQEQIIKLAEALIFIIRRRAVTDEYVPAVANLMLHGTAKTDLKEGMVCGRHVMEEKEQILLQKATDGYFGTGLVVSEEENEEDRIENDEEFKLSNPKDYWEERDVRLKTGGPVFHAEEAAVVRSLRITVLSEVIAESSSAVLAPFLKAFVRLVVEAFHLDFQSRAVTRSAALMAREIYGKVLTEGMNLAEALVGDGISDRSSVAEIPFSVALIASGEEEVLFATLKKGSRDASFHTSGKVVDSTLVTRCREALDIREQAKEKGIFAAAGLVLEEQRKLDEMPSIFRDIISIADNGESPIGADAEKNVFRLNPIEMLE